MNHERRLWRLIAVVLTALFATLLPGGCGRSNGVEGTATEGAGDGPKVAATTDIVGDVVAQIGGDRINLIVLLEPGQDPHGYEPTARQISSLSAMDVVFVNGFGLEEGLVDIVNEAATGTVVEVSAGITLRTTRFAADEDNHGHEAGGPDPHTWMSPLNVITWAHNIADALAAVDPTGAEGYRANAAAYVERLEQLDAWARDALGAIPPERRKLVTDHQVFGYFADEYGFSQVGFVVPGASTNTEATPRELASLVELIRHEGVGAIFIGESASPRLLQLADSIAGEAGNVSVLPVLTGSLAPKGEFGDNYLDLITFDVQQIVKGLEPGKEGP